MPQVVSITNQLTVPIDVYDEFNPDPAAQPSPPVQYTHLATIAPQATAPVQCIRDVALLLATVTGPVAELNGTYYYRFPVKQMSGTQVSYGNPPPLAYSVTPDDRTGAIQSFRFHRYVMANPADALTKKFQTALATGFAAVDAFFHGTQNFTLCTMESWANVLTWMDNEASAWQGKYYLYEKVTPAVPAGAPRLIAQLQVLSDASHDSATVAVCSLNDQGEVVFAQPAQEATLAMAGDGTMQSTDAVNGIAVTLTPVWMNVIGTPADGSTTPLLRLDTAVTGTVAGTGVISTHTLPPVASQPPDTSGSGEQESDSRQAEKWTVIISGALAAAAAVYALGKWIYKRWKARGEAARENASTQTELADLNRSNDAAAQAEIADPLHGVQAVQAANAANEQAVGDAERQQLDEQKYESSERAVSQRRNSVEDSVSEEIAEGLTPSDSFNTALSRMRSAADAAEAGLEHGDYSGMAEFSEAASSLESLSSQESQDVFESARDLQSELERAEEIRQAEELRAEQRREVDERAVEARPAAER